MSDYDAIRQGTYDAISNQLDTSGFRDAVYDAVFKCMPFAEDTTHAVADGLESAMPAAAAILETIRDGVSEAMPSKLDILDMLYRATFDAITQRVAPKEAP